MSVAYQLGLTDPQTGLLPDIRMRWAAWAARERRLGVVNDAAELRGWLADAGPAAADEVLLALAELSSPTGGDDIDATRTVAWVLLPGAGLIAHRLRGLTRRIDEVVAAQLWIEIRTFGWERGHKVAANVLMNTRKGVLRELGVGEHLRQADPAWYWAVPLSPTAEAWTSIQVRWDVEEPTPAHELVDVLAWAMQQRVITSSECRLLLCLAEEADRVGGVSARRGRYGLMAPAATEAVARRCGTSSRTVRRRARHSLTALGEAAARGAIPA